MRSETGAAEQKIEILVVEDSVTQAEQLKYLLEENGYMVAVAANGKEALAAVRQHRPGLVISDVMMPEMDGYTLCQNLKSQQNLRDTPVVLLTSLRSPIDIIKGLECGADNFIPKPYEDNYLLSRVRHILANAEIRKFQKTEIGLEVLFSNGKHFITSERQQILDLLLSTYETAVQTNLQLTQSQNQLSQLNRDLDRKVTERTKQLAAEVAERKRVEEEIRKLNTELEQRVIQRTRELEATTDFLNNVLESSTEYSIIAEDLDGNILTWNEGARRNYGYSAGEMVGKTNSKNLYTPEDIASGKVQAFLEIVSKAGKAEGVFERVRKSGSRFTDSVAVTLRRDADGIPVGRLVISKDITEQKSLEEQLRCKSEELEEQYRRVQEANRLKSEFLANMSHELRTPLNGIIGFAEIMHDGKVGPISNEHREYLGDILTSARHLLQLINDLLDLSKVEAGKMEFRPAELDLNVVVAEVCGIVRGLAASRRIQLKTEIDPALGSIVADSRSLKQILYNYLSNALKFTSDEGIVVLRVKTEGNADYRIEVEDSGIGIKTEDIGRLFVEFQQLDASAAKKYPGTGLGLALTKRIVEAQGGSVGVQSTPGKGSIFYAVLPRVFPLVGESAQTEQPAGAPLILIVEDDAQDRAWIAQELGEAGYAVEAVATGAEALVRCRERPFDAITLDMMLPDMSGRAVLGKIRERSLNQQTPIIVVSVLAHKEIGRGLEVSDILAKPLPANELLNALKRCGVKPQELTPDPCCE